MKSRLVVKARVHQELDRDGPCVHLSVVIFILRGDKMIHETIALFELDVCLFLFLFFAVSSDHVLHTGNC